MPGGTGEGCNTSSCRRVIPSTKHRGYPIRTYEPPSRLLVPPEISWEAGRDCVPTSLYSPCSFHSRRCLHGRGGRMSAPACRPAQSCHSAGSHCPEDSGKPPAQNPVQKPPETNHPIRSRQPRCHAKSHLSGQRRRSGNK